MSETDDDDVLAAERRRCRAMLSNDVAVLTALLDDRLIFSHATGAVDDKSAYLAKIAAGRIAYVTIDWREARVTFLAADVASLTGRMLSAVRVEGVEKRLDNRVSSAWVKDDGTWRLVVFQSTPMKV